MQAVCFLFVFTLNRLTFNLEDSAIIMMGWFLFWTILSDDSVLISILVENGSFMDGQRVALILWLWDWRMLWGVMALIDVNVLT